METQVISESAGVCKKHDVANYTRVIATADTPKGVAITVCPKCDRAACTVCGNTDWSGKLTECCGKSMMPDFKK